MNSCTAKIRSNFSIGIPIRFNPNEGYYKCYTDIKNKRICLVPDVKGLIHLYIRVYEKTNKRAIIQDCKLFYKIKNMFGLDIGDEIRIAVSDNSVIYFYEGINEN